MEDNQRARPLKVGAEVDKIPRHLGQEEDLHPLSRSASSHAALASDSPFSPFTGGAHIAFTFTVIILPARVMPLRCLPSLSFARPLCLPLV